MAIDNEQPNRFGDGTDAADHREHFTSPSLSAPDTHGDHLDHMPAPITMIFVGLGVESMSELQSVLASLPPPCPALFFTAAAGLTGLLEAVDGERGGHTSMVSRIGGIRNHVIPVTGTSDDRVWPNVPPKLPAGVDKPRLAKPERPILSLMAGGAPRVDAYSREGAVEFRVLGTLEVVDAERTLPLGSAQQRLVLALLLLHAPQPVLLERIVDELWGERPPASARHAVQVYVSGIRKLLGAFGCEVTVRTALSGYALDVDPERIDARRFQRLLDEAQCALRDRPLHARGLFEEALELWRGTPLSEFEGSDLARREADRLDELHTLAVEGLVEARLVSGEHGEVLGTLTGLVAADPLRERPRLLLMLALYRSGRHAEALAAYRDASRALDEIGLQPGPELRALEEAILRHDPLLPCAHLSSLSALGTGSRNRSGQPFR